jgi:teichuronic acid biosynthesis glycosyltransferase TuaG
VIASIVIPTYNQDPAKLQRALYSALAQTVRCEIIVVDDGSDERVPVSGAIRHETNLGIAAALNTGIRAMTTDWFCWLSSDDTFTPEKVEVQRTFLATKAGLASYHAFRVDGAGKCFQPWGTTHQQKRILRAGCAINGSTVMIHRDVFADVGLFDESFKFGQDWEMWCRIGWKYRWHGLDQILGDRYTGGNLTGRIMSDPELLDIKNAEDERVRCLYLV